MPNEIAGNEQPQHFQEPAILNLTIVAIAVVATWKSVKEKGQLMVKDWIQKGSLVDQLWVGS